MAKHKRSESARKGWETRRKNLESKRKRSESARKGWETRRRNLANLSSVELESRRQKRSESARKGWETRRKNKGLLDLSTVIKENLDNIFKQYEAQGSENLDKVRALLSSIISTENAPAVYKRLYENYEEIFMHIDRVLRYDSVEDAFVVNQSQQKIVELLNDAPLSLEQAKNIVQIFDKESGDNVIVHKETGEVIASIIKKQ